jgi:hypothetical protein
VDIVLQAYHEYRRIQADPSNSHRHSPFLLLVQYLQKKLNLSDEFEQSKQVLFERTPEPSRLVAHQLSMHSND